MTIRFVRNEPITLVLVSGVSPSISPIILIRDLEVETDACPHGAIFYQPPLDPFESFAVLDQSDTGIISELLD